jgi:SNF2 family DNA or RNA helicase
MIYKTKPLQHQEDAVNRFHKQEHGALFCEMGTGKTKIVLDIIRNSAKLFEAVVVAPNGLHHNWAINEIPKHLDPVEVYCWKGPIKTKKAKQEFERFLKVEGSRIFLINVEALRTSSGFETTSSFLKTCVGLKHMIVDESTCIKNPKAIQTKRVLDLAGAVDRRWILNGTPITQSPLDLFTQCRFLSKNAIPFNTYTAFKHSFAVETIVTMGSRAFRKVIGYQNLEQLTKLLEPFTLRIEKKDCLDLPDKTFVKQAIELHPQQKRVYESNESSSQRNKAVEHFQNGLANFFVGTSAAAKGLTLHRASTMVYYSNNYSLETRLQSQDRIHRIGQNNKCTYIDLVVPQTVDDAILKRLDEKKELSSMVLDDLIEIIK